MGSYRQCDENVPYCMGVAPDVKRPGKVSLWCSPLEIRCTVSVQGRNPAMASCDTYLPEETTDDQEKTF